MILHRGTVLHRPDRLLPLTEWPWWCGPHAAKEPRQFLEVCPAYRPTPLLQLNALAERLGIRSLCVKDETSRLGLASFKALGGAYAVLRLVQRRAEIELKRAIARKGLTADEVRCAVKNFTVCCASDGNHGRSVAAGARLVGARCVVFLHEGVSNERAAHIERLGATVQRVGGSYDDSVSAAARATHERGWTLVADVAEPGDAETEEICGFVMQGYTVLVDEIFAQARLNDLRFTHVLVQAGVGGLAASVFGHWTARAADGGRPQFIVVEPQNAACIMESARAGHIVRLPAGESTIMAMLECQSPSSMAWPIVSAVADGYVAVSDEEARRAVRQLADPMDTDPVIEAGESGAAGLAGLSHLLAAPHWRDRLDLGAHSDILIIATEGPTDLSTWSGRSVRGSEAIS